MKSMASAKLVVTGGRDFLVGGAPSYSGTDVEIRNKLESWKYARKALLYKALDAFNQHTPVLHLAHGGARGVDTVAGEWAEERGIRCQIFPANWKFHGKSAGHKRNVEMLGTFKPHYLLAFPGGVGTEHCVSSAVHFRRIKIVRVLIEGSEFRFERELQLTPLR